jgi:hypothetical protein
LPQHYKLLVFLRSTKKAFVSFLTPQILEELVQQQQPLNNMVPSYNAIRHASVAKEASKWICAFAGKYTALGYTNMA